jgi:hypothetical protein
VIVADQRRRKRLLVLGRDLDRIGLDHDVAYGDDVPAIVDHDAGTLAAVAEVAVAARAGQGLHPHPHHGREHLLGIALPRRLPGLRLVLRFLGKAGTGQDT